MCEIRVKDNSYILFGFRKFSRSGAGRASLLDRTSTYDFDRCCVYTLQRTGGEDIHCARRRVAVNHNVWKRNEFRHLMVVLPAVSHLFS